MTWRATSVGPCPTVSAVATGRPTEATVAAATPAPAPAPALTPAITPTKDPAPPLLRAEARSEVGGHGGEVDGDSVTAVGPEGGQGAARPTTQSSLLQEAAVVDPLSDAPPVLAASADASGESNMATHAAKAVETGGDFCAVRGAQWSLSSAQLFESSKEYPLDVLS